MAKRNEIPKGAAAEEELRRIRRREKRAERHRRKKIEALADREKITFAEAEARTVAEERETPVMATKAANPELITQDPSELPEEAFQLPTKEQLQRDLMIAFHSLGGVQGLTKWGQRNPKEFYALWGKYCLPDEDDDGEDGDSLEAMLAALDNIEEASMQ